MGENAKVAFTARWPLAAPTIMPPARIRSVDWAGTDLPEARLAWDALAGLAAEPNPFLESWYLLPTLRGLDPAHDIKLLRFECDGELAGLFPLQRTWGPGIWPMPQLRNWVHDRCFLGAPLVVAGLERQFWQALLDWADRNAGVGLFLNFGELALEGPLYRALQFVLGSEERPAVITQRGERPVLASSLSAEDYFECSVSASTREHLRRQFSHLSELGEVRIERRTGDERISRWIEDFIALDLGGGSSVAEPHLGSSREAEQLFKEVLSGAASRGRLERLALLLDDEPIAMLANFITPPGAFSFAIAIDGRYARYSPEALLQHANLDLLDHPEVHWCDACATDKAMINHIWHERRRIGSISIAIGGRLRRAAFARMLKAKLPQATSPVPTA